MRKKNPKLREVARLLGASPSSVSEEVKRNRFFAKGKHKGMFCEDEIEAPSYCNRLSRWPYVCSGCNARHACYHRSKVDYAAVKAQERADAIRKLARSGTRKFSETERIEILDITADSLAKNVSPAVIVLRVEQELGIKISKSSLYRWIHKDGALGILSLPLASRYKPRKKIKQSESAITDTKRLMQAFNQLSAEERVSAVQLDTVEGRKSDKTCILSIHFPRAHFQLYAKLSAKAPQEVARVLDAIEKAIGKAEFHELFRVSLADRGSEFRDPELLEKSVLDKRFKRTKIFFTNPCAPHEKGACERNHRELRGVLPKADQYRPARSFDILDQTDCNLICSHVNSKPRASLRGKTPTQVFKYMYPEAFKGLQKLFHIEEIDYGHLNLSPSLVKGGRWD